MTFRLTVLGSSSALPIVGKYPTACVLNAHEQFFLIDAGEGVQKQLMKYGVSLRRLSHIFITHLHGDHLFGLFGLVSTMGLLGREQALHIYAPAPLEKIMTTGMELFFKDLPFPIVHHTVKTTASEQVFENNAMTVTTIPLKHKVPTCGYLFREKEPQLNVDKEAVKRYSLSIQEILAVKRGEDIIREDGSVIENGAVAYRPYSPRSFAFCSDTAYSEKVASAVKGVNLLYHEATFSDSDRERATQTGHSTARDAATVAMKAGVGKLVIGHFSSRYKEEDLLLSQAKEVFDNTFLGLQGSVFDIEPVNVRF